LWPHLAQAITPGASVLPQFGQLTGVAITHLRPDLLIV
jgi:hypothetical protein